MRLKELSNWRTSCRPSGPHVFCRLLIKLPLPPVQCKRNRLRGKYTHLNDGALASAADGEADTPVTQTFLDKHVVYYAERGLAPPICHDTLSTCVETHRARSSGVLFTKLCVSYMRTVGVNFGVRINSYVRYALFKSFVSIRCNTRRTGTQQKTLLRSFYASNASATTDKTRRWSSVLSGVAWHRNQPYVCLNYLATCILCQTLPNIDQ